QARQPACSERPGSEISIPARCSSISRSPEENRTVPLVSLGLGRVRARVRHILRSGLPSKIPNLHVELTRRVLHHGVLAGGERLLRPNFVEAVGIKLLAEDLDLVGFLDRFLRYRNDGHFLCDTHVVMRCEPDDGEALLGRKLYVEFRRIGFDVVAGAWFVDLYRRFAG